jgi:hypothetical protein
MRILARQFGHAAILTRVDADRWGYRHALQSGAWGSQLMQYFYQDGHVQALGSHPFPILPGYWYSLRAEVDGAIIRSFINGLRISIYDGGKHLGRKGSVLIEAGPGTFVCIDNLVVRSLDRSPEALAAARQGQATQAANVRFGPGLTYGVIAGLYAEQPVYIIKGSDDGQWVYVRKANSSTQGWVWAAYIREITPMV